jgi:hypothetical protein
VQASLEALRSRRLFMRWRCPVPSKRACRIAKLRACLVNRAKNTCLPSLWLTLKKALDINITHEQSRVKCLRLSLASAR